MIVGTSTSCSAVCSAKCIRRLRGGQGVGEILGTSIACSGMRTSKSRHTSTSWFSICGTGTSSHETKSTVSTICSTVCRWSLSCGLTSYSRSGRVPPSSSSNSEEELGVPGHTQHLAPQSVVRGLHPGSLLAPWSIVRHGPNITAVMKGCCQGHLQRKLFVPPVDEQPTVTTPLRCPSFVVAMQRHVNHCAQTSDHTKKGNTNLSSLVVVVVCLFVCLAAQ